jgi:PST family polysaccharide transporter
MGSLATIQIANAVSPLIIYPYVLTVVGAEGYADIALAEAVALFLLTFVLYSFDIDAVAAVVGLSVRQDNPRISRTFSEILLVRVGFYFIGLCVLQAVILIINPRLSLLVLQWSLVSLSYAVQPNWLFQALEWNLPLAVVVLISRLGAVATIVFSIHQPEDHVLVPGIIGAWYFASAVVAAGYAVRRFDLTLTRPSLSTLCGLIWHGKEVFLSNVGITLYRDVNVLLLGALGVPSAGIAAYSLAEKLVKAIQASIRPLNQFFFPRALTVAKDSVKPSRTAFIRILKVTLPQVAVVLCVIVGLFSGYAILGSHIPALGRIDNVGQVIGLAATMSVAIIPGVANFMFGSAGLNALGARRYLLVAVVVVGLASVASNCVLIPLMGAAGSAICFVLAECLLLALVARRYFVV